MKARLLLVRHGQTASNAQARFMGQLDIPLDEVGHAQAQAVAQRLAAERPAAIYSSDLVRARETASAIQSAIDSGVPLKIDTRLREINLGDWQGRTYAELREQDPQALVKWETGRTEFAAPNGETLSEFAARVQAAYRDICFAHSDDTAIVAAHGGVLQVLITQALALPLEAYWKISISNASLSELRVFDAGAMLHLLNDVGHLPPAG